MPTFVWLWWWLMRWARRCLLIFPYVMVLTVFLKRAHLLVCVFWLFLGSITWLRLFFKVRALALQLLNRLDCRCTFRTLLVDVTVILIRIELTCLNWQLLRFKYIIDLIHHISVRNLHRLIFHLAYSFVEHRKRRIIDDVLTTALVRRDDDCVIFPCTKIIWTWVWVFHIQYYNL